MKKNHMTNTFYPTDLYHTDHMQTRNKNNKGSMLIEIILSLTIFSIICLPILAFILSTEDYQNTKNQRDTSKYEEKVATNLQWFNPKNINEYTNRHSCDLAILEYIRMNASEQSSQPISGLPTVSYPTFFQHQRNIPSVIRSVSHAGKKYLIIGTNSASTTDSDMYVFMENISIDSITGTETRTYDFVRELETGPGVVDFDISDGFLYAIERSVVQPLWRVSLDDLLSPSDSTAHASTSTSTSVTIGITTSIPILVQNTLPLRIMATKDRLYLGLDKNTDKELRVLERIENDTDGDGTNNTTDYTFVLSYGAEIDAGINDMASTPHELLIASPNNTELIGFLQEIPDLGTSPIISRLFDAPGSFGNGKSLNIYKNKVNLGRTVGNTEFFRIDGLIDDVISEKVFSVETTLDLDKSILQIEEIFGGAYIVVLTKTPQQALLLFAKSPVSSSSQSDTPDPYVLKEEIALPAIPTHMTCNSNEFIVTTESTSTPVAIIRF